MTPVLILGLLATVPFLPAMRGGWILDDRRIHEDPLLYNLRTYGFRYWWQHERLLTRLTHQLTKHSLLASHLFNIGLHLAAVETVYSVLVRSPLSTPAAIAAAAVFAVHPMQVHSVGYIGARAGLLSFLFAILLVRILMLVLVEGNGWALVFMPLLVFLGTMTKEDFAIYLFVIVAGAAWLTWA